MYFETALDQELKTIAALQNRVYPLASPEATKHNGVPYLVYGSSEGQRDKTITDGFLDSKRVPVEINVIAERYNTMKAITREVIALLVGIEQRTIGSNGPFIEELTYEPPVELYEDLPKLYRCVIECTVYFGQGG